MLRTAIAAALFAATSTIVLASEYDSNPANRFPAFAAPLAATQEQGALRTVPVRLESGQDAATTGQPYEIERGRRASPPHAGGVG